MRKISVIIPLFEYAGIDEVLASLFRSTGCVFEVVVIDNSERPERVRLMAEIIARFPQVRYYKQERNLGVTGGRNAGFAAADPASDYILFLDHDVSMRDDCLKNLVADFEAIAAREPIGVLTGKVLYKGAPGEIWAAGTDIGLFTGKVRFYHGRDDGSFDGVRKVGVAPSIIFTRRTFVERYGGFDDRFFANYDDTEFCFRYRKHGLPTFYTPRAVGYHDIPLTAPDEHRLLDRGYYLARNRILFMRRYARCYPLFLCLVPLWCLYYLNRYRRNGRLADFRDYWRGTWDGLLNRDGRARGDTIASGLEEETGVKEESGFRVKGSGGPAPDSRPLTPEPWLVQDEAKPWLR